MANSPTIDVPSSRTQCLSATLAAYTADLRLSVYVVLVLAHRLRRWANINTILTQRECFSWLIRI